MHAFFVWTVVALCSVVASGPRIAAGAGGDSSWLVQRVGGDAEIQTEFKVDRYTCGESYVEAPLPDGYPAPTPPGAIDLKRYPAVRRAEVSGSGDTDRDRTGAFWPLLNHIKQRDIAMTSPVEVDLRGENGWTMSFLYRRPDLGPIGRDGRVSVVDSEPATVASIGLRGPYGGGTVERGLDRLNAWLDGQSDWEAAGDPRALYYNGPYIPDGVKWAEVQIPIRRAGDRATATPTIALAPSFSPARFIELAVERGAPLFNGHQPEACAAIYEITTRWLLEAVPQLDPAMRTRLAEALDTAQRELDPFKQAWTLRHALDDVYRNLTASARASRG